MEATEPCPCGSGATFGACCGQYIDGTAAAPTAEALMRSRYSAFATGAIDYLVDTHDPETAEGVERDEIERWSTQSQWLGFELHLSELGQPDDDTGVVAFTAHYSDDAGTHAHAERSTFVKRDGRWLFHEARPYSGETVRRSAPKVGRNDPCPCGSGAKFKRCCGAAA